MWVDDNRWIRESFYFSGDLGVVFPEMDQYLPIVSICFCQLCQLCRKREKMGNDAQHFDPYNLPPGYIYLLSSSIILGGRVWKVGTDHLPQAGCRSWNNIASPPFFSVRERIPVYAVWDTMKSLRVFIFFFLFSSFWILGETTIGIWKESWWCWGMLGGWEGKIHWVVSLEPMRPESCFPSKHEPGFRNISNLEFFVHHSLPMLTRIVNRLKN